MGVPKFFRWLSERYPKIIQTHGCRASEELCQEHFGKRLPRQVNAVRRLEIQEKTIANAAMASASAGGLTTTDPDEQEEYEQIVERVYDEESLPPAGWLSPDQPLAECGLPPEIDRLYIDFNGILHGCSHNNQREDEFGNKPQSLPEEETFRNVAYYLDRVVKEIAKPQELLYIAIDGVAPRAKLNQQRARRYLAANQGKIERTIYDAHMDTLLGDKPKSHQNLDDEGGEQLPRIREVEPGRFSGKFETEMSTTSESTSGASSEPAATSIKAGDGSELGDYEADDAFHSNAITPGTPWFQRCTDYLISFIERKVKEDPQWQNLSIVFSGPNVPGEGEHKIMQFIREQKQRPDYNPNLRHCIMGQDGDLIMLGLATHEPNLTLLRERVLFGKKAYQYEEIARLYDGMDMYIHNPNFEFLHMNILRDYIALDFETSNVLPDSPFDLERVVDDFVFMTFFVGNDFLPHMPALDIADESFDILFVTYRHVRKKWLADGGGDDDEEREEIKRTAAMNQTQVVDPYLTYAGNIVSGERLESFLSAIGSFEEKYFEFKTSTKDFDKKLSRKLSERHGMNSPSDEAVEAKEESDRMRYREMIESTIISIIEDDDDDENVESAADSFQPVMSSKFFQDYYRDNPPEKQTKEVKKRMDSILQSSISSKESMKSVDDRDVKGRYYYDKFGFSPFDAEKHIALRKAYIEGLVWNLKYYYEGCVSWEWFYPYYYGPMISDLVNLQKIIDGVSFEGRMGEPLEPFQQLLACLPPSHTDLLPEPYRPLMTEENSPIKDFYPKSFTVDMNGKRWPWEAVILLPFTDSKRLIEAAKSVDVDMLSKEEKERNEFGETFLWHNGSNMKLDSSPWFVPKTNEKPVFKPFLPKEAEVPLPGFPTLLDGSIKSLWRRCVGLNVHGSPSRYNTGCLEFTSIVSDSLPIETLANLIGTVVYIDYPHFIEAYVTGVSDSSMFVRGKNKPAKWNAKEAAERRDRTHQIVSGYMFGQEAPGSGGMAMAQSIESMKDLDVLLNVRPLRGVVDGPNGKMKVFAKFEIEVPLFVTSWAPVREDPRLAGVPALLEKDPFGVVFANDLEVDPLKAAAMFINKKSQAGNINVRNFHSAPLEHSLFSGPQIQGPSFSAGFMGSKQFNRTSFPVGHNTYSTTLNIRQGKPVRRYSSLALRPSSNAGAGARGKLLVLGLATAASFFAVTGAVDFSATKSNWGKTWKWFPSSIHERFHSFPVLDNAITATGSDRTSDTPPLEFAHGTTTLSFVFRDGIVVAVDSRASLGSFVGSKTTKKLLPIHKTCIGTMAGGAADCSFWIRKIRAEAALYELTKGHRMSISRASTLISNALYDNRGLGLSVGTMIMGFDDDRNAKPRIFYADNSGMRIEGDMFAIGSGSTFALGILDTSRRYDMTTEEAVALGIKAIRYATFRDAGSGGYINVFLITKDGWKHILSEDLARLPLYAQNV